MNLPGFDAESSLVPTKGIYRSNGVSGRSGMVEMAIDPKSNYGTTIYGAYISHWFPVTVCEPIFINEELVKSMELSTSVPDRMSASHTVESLRFSVPQTTLNGRMNCSVKHVPFIANIITIE